MVARCGDSLQVHNPPAAPAPQGICPYFSYLVQKIVELLVRKPFYVGWVFTPKLGQDRRQEAINKKQAVILDCKNPKGVDIDALYIASSSPKKTGNAIVFALNTSYQDFNPRHYEPLLANGADVVLWNPTVLEGKQFAEDLSTVLQALKAKDPQQKIAIKSYCASVDPAIAVAAEMNDPNISLIVDRGWGDVQQMARSFTVVAKLPVAKKVLKEKFDCEGMGKITSVKGKILFLAPPEKEDQAMYWRGRNLTYELREKRPHDQFFELPQSDHWTKWNFVTYNRVQKFLSENGIIAPQYEEAGEHLFPTRTPPSFFGRYIVPILTKSWFCC